MFLIFFLKGKQIKNFKLLYINFFFFSSQGGPGTERGAATMDLHKGKLLNGIPSSHTNG